MMRRGASRVTPHAGPALPSTPPIRPSVSLPVVTPHVSVRGSSSRVSRTGFVPIVGLPRLRSEVVDANDLPRVVPFRAQLEESTASRTPRLPAFPAKSATPDGDSPASTPETSVVPAACRAAARNSIVVPAPILCFWPKQECNGKGTGHVALSFPDGQYFSYIMVARSAGAAIGRPRIDVPGFAGVPMQARRHPLDPARTFVDDVKAFGPLNYAIVLPKVFVEDVVRQWVRSMVLQSEEGERLPGPLPYYQLFDSETEEGGGWVRNTDRQQCASMLARCLSQSVKPEFQELVKLIGAQFEPRGVTNAVVEVSANLPEEQQWSTESFPFGHLDPDELKK